MIGWALAIVLEVTQPRFAPVMQVATSHDGHMVVATSPRGDVHRLWLALEEGMQEDEGAEPDEGGAVADKIDEAVAYAHAIGDEDGAYDELVIVTASGNLWRWRIGERERADLEGRADPAATTLAGMPARRLVARSEAAATPPKTIDELPAPYRNLFAAKSLRFAVDVVVDEPDWDAQAEDYVRKPPIRQRAMAVCKVVSEVVADGIEAELTCGKRFAYLGRAWRATAEGLFQLDRRRHLPIVPADLVPHRTFISRNGMQGGDARVDFDGQCGTYQDGTSASEGMSTYTICGDERGVTTIRSEQVSAFGTRSSTFTLR